MAKELDFLTKRSEDYSKWYNELVVKANLAEQSDVRGCMVKHFIFCPFVKRAINFKSERAPA